jgi:hypothetical protein
MREVVAQGVLVLRLRNLRILLHSHQKPIFI